MDATWIRGAEGQERLAALATALKSEGRGKKYDAMIGLSGGIDSAFLAHYAVRTMGLRVLAVHVDGGWNSSHAVRNIERIVRGLDLDLHTHVVEWSEMADLQLAFIKSSVMNQDIPQDHAFFSNLYRTAAEFDIPYFLSGVNFASECVEILNIAGRYADAVHIRAIHGKFGRQRLQKFRLMGLWEYLFRTKIQNKPKILKPLDYMDYDKGRARTLLQQEYGWADYGDKHCESRFTKFYQEIYLPMKYGFDKRRLHLSSQIVSGHKTRQDALDELAQPITSESAAKRDIRFVAKKLGVSLIELTDLLKLPPVDHEAYRNGKRLFDFLIKLRSLAVFWRPSR